MSLKRYISVILPLKLEWEPCYWVSSERETPDQVGVETGTEIENVPEAEVGQRVRVKFAGKEYVGVISGVDVVPEINLEKVLPVLEVETAMEKVLKEEIALWRRVAEYYMCTVGEVYKAAYPSSKINLEEARAQAREKAVQRREKMVITISRRLQTLQERLQKKQSQFEKSLQAAKHKSEQAAKHKSEQAANNKSEQGKEGRQWDGQQTKTAIKIKADIAKISEDILRTETSLEIARRNVEAARKGLNLNQTELPECKVQLTEVQQNAFNIIHEGFDAKKPVLLHGVTGSGKTEIYIKAAHEALSKGQNVLYLVPEIALSRQLEDRLYEHFEDRLLIFHSGETAAAKRNMAEIIRTQQGKTGNYILLGTRSSLFLPHHNLGLIIVDEEHDSSYKQDSPAPRYNGRDTALMLYQLQNSEASLNADANANTATHRTAARTDISVRPNGCNIILGSATPSLEELYNCLNGRHIKVELEERYHGAEDAEIQIIDTQAERKKRGMIGNFSRILIGHINDALADGGQVLILRARRAWATALQCESCGEIQKCPHCNVSLSFHKAAGQQKCHYCGKTITHTGYCSKCGGQLQGFFVSSEVLHSQQRIC